MVVSAYFFILLLQYYMEEGVFIQGLGWMRVSDRLWGNKQRQLLQWYWSCEKYFFIGKLKNSLLLIKIGKNIVLKYKYYPLQIYKELIKMAIKTLITSIIFVIFCLSTASMQVETQPDNKKALPEGFSYLHDIDPTIIIQPRYAIPGNFVGDVVKGYLRQTVIMSTAAAAALKGVQDTFRGLGYGLVVYDAYRPQKAVDDFIRWSKAPEDNKTKEQFYPYINKQSIIPDGYVAEKSGHSRGSTVDLTIIRLNKQVTPVKLIDYKLRDNRVIKYRDDGTEFMGGHFDLFDLASHHDTMLVDANCTQLRNLLRSVMGKWNFRPLKEEWWHYTLNNQPFPTTYFDFDVV